MTDDVEHGPPPQLGVLEAGFGSRALRPGGVRLMLKGFQLMVDQNDGEPVAYIDVHRASAIKARRAIDQALADVSAGRFR